MQRPARNGIENQVSKYLQVLQIASAGYLPGSDKKTQTPVKVIPADFFSTVTIQKEKILESGKVKVAKTYEMDWWIFKAFLQLHSSSQANLVRLADKNVMMGAFPHGEGHCKRQQ